MRLFLLTIFSIFHLVVFSQIENIVFTLHLKNGDILTGNSDVTEITLKTNYGNLTFPVGDITSINIGLQNTNFDKIKLLELLDKVDLGNSREKEKAFDAIIAMKESTIPFIKSYIQNSKQINPNDELSVSVLYEVMLAKYNIKKNYSLYDEIIFNGKNSIEGTYNFLNIILETQYGRIKISRSSIESIDIKILQKGTISKDNVFKVFANRYILGNKTDGWLNTSILVKKGDQIKITADGNATIASLSGNIYSPDGGINGASGPSDKKVHFGQLIFKISENGKTQKAGENISFTAEKTGIVYLSIYETVYNSANSGYYTAKVKVKK